MIWAVPFYRSRLLAILAVFAMVFVSTSCHKTKIATQGTPQPLTSGRTPIATQANPAPPTLGRTADWIDLQSGWRLRVTTPIIEGGGYSLKTKPTLGNATMTMNADQTAATINLTAGDSFLGYEVAYYSLNAQKGGGLNVKLKSVEQNLNKQPPTAPETPLYTLPTTLPFVRLLHMLRVSDLDHDDALLSGATQEDVKTITEQVQADPATCRNTRRTSCSWVPTGVALLPQGNVGTPTVEKWVGLP